MINNEEDYGRIRRADFTLKTKYWGLDTKIYLIEHHHYAIQLLNYLNLFQEISLDFNKNIRNAGDYIELVIEKPQAVICEIKPTQNIAYNNEGIFLNHEMLESLLISRFCNVRFLRINVTHNNGVELIIEVGDETHPNDIYMIKQFVLDLKIGFSNVMVTAKSSENSGLINTKVELACTDNRFVFSKLDSEFWFENVERIYEGNLTRENLRFFDSSKTKCYMDFSVWNNENINIRSTALLYDTVYISFPLGEHINTFLEQQHLSMADLEVLIEQNKLVVLLPNTESRYDKKIIDHLCGVNHNNIVSKRGINAVMAMFYCELEQKYMSFWNGKQDLLQAICEDCFKASDKTRQIVSDWILWPMRARRESFELLTNYSPIMLQNIGANTLFEQLFVNHEQGKNISFELMMNSNSIHIASALQATYFPFSTSSQEGIYSDYSVANLLGSIINMYQYTSQKQQDSIRDYTEALEKERKAIYLLNTDNSVSLKNILDYGKKYSTTTTLTKILNNISNLSEDKQKQRITEYNNLIAEIGEEKIGGKAIMNYVLSGAGFIPTIGTAASIISLLGQIFDDSGIMRELIKRKVSSGNGSVTDEVYLLDKLSRVARLTFQSSL